MSQSIRVFRASCLLVLFLALPATAQQWSRDFGAMGLDGDGSSDGEGYCLGEFAGDLYVGGWFEEAGDEPAMHVARWNGHRWFALGGGVNQIPEFVYGTDYNLYVGGPFWQVDGEDWAYCARWDGSWHQMPALTAAPTCAVFDGVRLWVGGSFPVEEYPYYPVGMMFRIGDEWQVPDNFGNWNLWEDEAHAIAHGVDRMHLGGDIMRVSAGNDTTWSHVCWSQDEGGLEYGRGLEGGHVEAFVPSGPHMWIGGSFSHADGQRAEGLVQQAGSTYVPANWDGIARDIYAMTEWNGGLYVVADEGDGMDHHWVVRRYGNQQWSAPLGGEFTDGINAIFGHADGDLYVGGFFDNGVVRWDNHDDEWVHLGGGIGRVHHDRHWFKALTVFEGDIIAAGDEVRLPAVLEGQLDCENVVRWDGKAWHRLGDGIGPDVSSLAVYQGVLYAGLPSGEGALERLQRWDGEDWQDAADADNQILCLALHGDDLVAGGYFTTMGGAAAARVAAFDGAAWRGLGTGMDGGVRVLFENEGILYAGGSFTTADGNPANRVARWTGDAWEAMGAGFDDGHVYALTAYEGEIYAGGSFTASGGAPRGHVARWDGAAWQPLAEGVGGDIFYGVAALRGTTTGLYVGGDFATAGGAPASGLALWDGAWSELGGGVSEPYAPRPTVSAMLVHEGDLWVGGQFTRVAGDIPSYCIAQWEDGALVPNLLTAFDAAPRPDGTVDLWWRVAPELATAGFRLGAAAGEEVWEVAYASADSRFTAHDAAPGLAGATEVRYTLAFRHDGEWLELGEAGVRLTPPRAVRLHDAVPNPFNPVTRIAFELDHAQDLRVEVYDPAGRRLAVLASGTYQAGSHTVTWLGCDDRGRAMPSGAYLVRLSTESTVRSTKVMLAR